MIYYFASQDSSEKPSVDDWDIWNYFIPFGDSSEGVFIGPADDIYEINDISEFQEKLIIVSFKMPEIMMQDFISAVFKVFK